MRIPGYTASLLIWIVPVIFLSAFFVMKKLLSPEKMIALAVTIGVSAAVGIVLDIFFARWFFTFPNALAVCGIALNGIPVEEFAFYIFGDCFVVCLYVFCDEWFLLKYNVDNRVYIEYRSCLSKLFCIHGASVLWLVAILACGFVVKRFMNPQGLTVPGYFYFLVLCAFVPMILLLQVTKRFVNWRAFAAVTLATILVAVIWEVTMALPCGWWGYQRSGMLGIFVKQWNDLPIEAVLMWLASSQVILIYEFTKIGFFTENPSVPGYRLLSRFGPGRGIERTLAKPAQISEAPVSPNIFLKG